MTGKHIHLRGKGLVSARKIILSLPFLFCATLCASCGWHKETAGDGPVTAESTTPAAVEAKKDDGGALPVQFQYPSYVVGQEDDAAAISAKAEPVVKVGAKIETRHAPQPLWAIMKGLADLKRMNVSWASDVNQNAPVDVHINADDDFYQAIGDLLRQLDYYYEMRGNTIIVKYKETRNFQIAMPFVKTLYSTGVGGNLLGNEENSKSMDGTIQLKSDKNEFDIWDNIQTNLDSLLDIWALDPRNKAQSEPETVMSDAVLIEKCRKDNANDPSLQEACLKSQKNSRDNMAKLMGELNQGKAEKGNKSASGKGKNGNSYIIDKPVGIITVSAPRPLLEKVEEYITNLKKSLYRQVAIEAKIIEVQLSDSSSIGINWNQVLQNFAALSGAINFGAQGQVYPYISAASGQGSRVYGYQSGSGALYQPGADGAVRIPATANSPDALTPMIMASSPLQDPGRFISSVILAPASFSAMINALKTEGNAKVLSSPKLSVMNGQPAMISVGTNYTYIKSVQSNVASSGSSMSTTYTVETARLLSGLGMSLTATILGDDEIILNLVPVISELVKSANSAANPDEPIYTKTVGMGDQATQVSLPVINVREMSTTVKVRDGEMLAIGGLISETEKNEGNFVPILGSIPIVKYLFGYETKQKQKNELIILLKPKIIP